MAECPSCGKEAQIWNRDLISGICKECMKAEAREAKQQREADQAVRAAEQAALARVAQEQAEAATARLELRVRDRILKLKQSMVRRLDAGHPVIIYHSIYLPVDSMLLDEPMNGKFDTSALFQMGLQGWEAIQIIPRTVGTGLKNTSIGSTMGVTWGGGSGGNVAGVHVLLRKTLVSSDVNVDADDELARIIRSHIQVE